LKNSFLLRAHIKRVSLAGCPPDALRQRSATGACMITGDVAVERLGTLQREVFGRFLLNVTNMLQRNVAATLQIAPKKQCCQQHHRNVTGNVHAQRCASMPHSV